MNPMNQSISRINAAKREYRSWRPAAIIAAACLLLILLLLGGSFFHPEVPVPWTALAALTALALIAGFMFRQCLVLNEESIRWRRGIFRPIRVRYDSIAYAEALYAGPSLRGKSLPGSAGLRLVLKDGKTCDLPLGGFSREAVAAIVSEVERRISATDGEMVAAGRSSYDGLSRSLRVRHRMIAVFFGGALVFSSALALRSLFVQSEWAGRLKTWEKVESTVIRHERRTVNGGRHSRPVSDIRFEYEYMGKKYEGSRIVFGGDCLPGSIKAGARQLCIVNPADPKESALLFRWNHPQYWRYRETIGYGVLSYLLLSVLLWIGVQKSSLPKLPSALEEYLKNIPDEISICCFRRASRFRLPAGGGPNVTAPFECADRRFGGFFLRHRFRTALGSRMALLAFLLILPFLAVSVRMLWLNTVDMALLFTIPLIVPLGVAATRLYAPYTVFDFSERRVGRCRRFKPDVRSIRLSKTLSFDRTDFLWLAPRYHGTFALHLLAVTADDRLVPLAEADLKHAAELLNAVVPIADKLGGPPVLIKGIEFEPRPLKRINCCWWKSAAG
jgi:hypothetical protein